ncbi:hypothetical protein BURCENBC7_AP0341 [Burkholderia cenocepacia BC7]|nr:hypothetical protein BURCENK562V_C7072 [Burkholderia cenocepacia K56-2Valvano]ERI24628.1 hypothetical protein BURCENBC7_AP0341 [Burkholderia cenocepacia BC7]
MPVAAGGSDYRKDRECGKQLARPVRHGVVRVVRENGRLHL